MVFIVKQADHQLNPRGANVPHKNDQIVRASGREYNQTTAVRSVVWSQRAGNDLRGGDQQAVRPAKCPESCQEPSWGL